MTLPDFSVSQWGGGETVAQPNKLIFAPRSDAIDAWQLYHAGNTKTVFLSASCCCCTVHIELLLVVV